MKLSEFISKVTNKLRQEGDIDLKTVSYDASKSQHIVIIGKRTSREKQYESSEAHLFDNEQKYNPFVDESMDYHDRILAETGHY